MSQVSIKRLPASSSCNILRGEINKIQTLSDSFNIRRKIYKKISKPSSSCNMLRGEIQKIQRLVFSKKEYVIYCNGGAVSCIFSAKKSSIVQLKISICIFAIRNPFILQLAERTCIFHSGNTSMLQLARGADKLLAPHCIFSSRNTSILQLARGADKFLAPHCILFSRNSTILKKQAPRMRRLQLAFYYCLK